MSNTFSHLKSAQVGADQTVEYVFYGLEGEPTLYVRPSWDVNRGYANARLKTSRPYTRAVRTGNLNAAMLAQVREEDRELFPRHVVAGWKEETVLDSKGKPVPFSQEKCEEFLKAVPDDMMDDLRDFCGQPSNFRSSDGASAAAVDVEAVSGN